MTAFSLPVAASHLGVPVRVLRRAIRLGTIPAPANLNALSLLSEDWFASVEQAVAANPKALKVFPQKVPAFARYEGTSCFRKYPNRVREYNAHRRSVAA